MESMLIFTIMASLLGTIISAGTQGAANTANQQNYEQSLEYSREAAQTANKTTVQQYETLYSPQAKVQQYKEAGLNPALMYQSGQGAIGSTAAQATTPAAPTINPLLQPDFMNKIVESAKTMSETKKNEEEVNSIQKQIEKADAEIKKIEEECKNYAVSRYNTELQNKLTENQLKVSNATIDEQIETVRENLKLIHETYEKTHKEVMVLDVEWSKREQLLDAEIKKLQAEEKKLIQDELLGKAQTACEWAKEELIKKQKELTEKQVRELELKIEQVEKLGWMTVNGSGWQDKLISMFLGALEDLTNDMTLGEAIKNWWERGKNLWEDRPEWLGGKK